MACKYLAHLEMHKHLSTSLSTSSLHHSFFLFAGCKLSQNIDCSRWSAGDARQLQYMFRTWRLFATQGVCNPFVCEWPNCRHGAANSWKVNPSQSCSRLGLLKAPHTGALRSLLLVYDEALSMNGLPRPFCDCSFLALTARYMMNRYDRCRC